MAWAMQLTHEFAFHSAGVYVRAVLSRRHTCGRGTQSCMTTTGSYLHRYPLLRRRPAEIPAWSHLLVWYIWHIPEIQFTSVVTFSHEPLSISSWYPFESLHIILSGFSLACLGHAIRCVRCINSFFWLSKYFCIGRCFWLWSCILYDWASFADEEAMSI